WTAATAKNASSSFACRRNWNIIELSAIGREPRMSKANVKLQLIFDLDVAVPERLLELDHESLCKTFSEVLGTMVFQGLPTVAGKQLAKAGGSIVGHHHHLSATSLAPPPLDRDVLIAAAPHLTDDELDQLARNAHGRLPES